MAQKRKTHAEELKARVAVEAIKGVRRLSELSAAPGIHPTGIAHWKRQLEEGAPEVFRRGSVSRVRSEETVTAPLYQEIGRLKMELEGLKKSFERVAGGATRMAASGLQDIVDGAAVCLGGPGPLDVLVRADAERAENLALMRLIDELYLKRPFDGVPRMTDWLQTLGHVSTTSGWSD